MSQRYVRLLPILLTVAVGSGCLERQGIPVAPCTNVTIGDAIQVNNVDKVDLLFMVDNSNSMTEEQASLAVEFPRMINILTTGDFNPDDGMVPGESPDDFDPVKNLNVGVITSDMGTAGHTVPTCSRSDFGDDGILRNQGRTDISGCMATYPMFLNFQTDTGGSTDAFAQDVACVATVGTGGCGFEQQLEAMLKAGSPTGPTPWTAPGYTAPGFFNSTVGHGNMENDGFFRADAVLALIPVTDEEDCSASDGDLFNPGSPTYGATDLNLRCFAHPDALHPISRYVDGFLNLRVRPSLLIYAPIVGIPTDLAPAPGTSPDYDRLVGPEGTRDDRMLERIDPAMPTRLQPSCNEPGRGLAFPPVRMVRVAQELENRGAGVTVQSICQDSFRNALGEIIRQIKSALGAACLPRQLNLEADGTVSCDVVAVLPTGQGCDSVAGASPKIEGGVEVVEVDEAGGTHAVCTLDQLVPDSRAAGSAAPGGSGWFYDTFTSEGLENCGDTFQRIAFTVQPPPGAEVRLECFQAVQATGEGDITIGTFCDPSPGGVNMCGSGMNPGGGPLECDPVGRTCAVRCSTDADCPAAGLVGFRCDQRPLNVVAPDEFPDNADAYNFCVNPTCG